MIRVATAIFVFLAVQAGAAQSPPRIIDVAPDQRSGQQLAQQLAPPPTVLAERIELRGLDTLNGRTEDLSLTIGETVTFGHLEIAADSCRVPEGDPAGDAQAFLRIRDVREEAPRFSGWMFASSPALSALDHPRYDVWVLSCSSR